MGTASLTISGTLKEEGSSHFLYLILTYTKQLCRTIAHGHLRGSAHWCQAQSAEGYSSDAPETPLAREVVLNMATDDTNDPPPLNVIIPCLCSRCDKTFLAPPDDYCLPVGLEHGIPFLRAIVRAHAVCPYCGCSKHWE
jgi:hypothetical protein